MVDVDRSAKLMDVAREQIKLAKESLLSGDSMTAVLTLEAVQDILENAIEDAGTFNHKVNIGRQEG